MKKKIQEDEGVIIDYVKLDEKYNITEGDMFGDIQKLTEQNIEYIKGVWEKINVCLLIICT